MMVNLFSSSRFCSRDDHRDNFAAIISRAGAAISEKKISLESEFNSAEFRYEKIKPNSQVFISLGFRSRRIFTGIWTGASLNIPYSDFYGDPSAKTAALFRPRRINGPASIFTRFVRGARREARTRWFSLSPGGQQRAKHVHGENKNALLNGALFARVHAYLSRPNERYRGRHFPLSILRDYVTLRSACVYECKLNFRPRLRVNESLEQREIKSETTRRPLSRNNIRAYMCIYIFLGSGILLFSSKISKQFSKRDLTTFPSP